MEDQITKWKVGSEQRLQSSGVVVEIPILPELRAELENVPDGQLTILAKDDGSLYHVKSLSNLFKGWFVEAGVGECSVHSLRKGAAAIAAENGATENELKALFGWTTSDQPSTYTREANRKKMAAKSAQLISLTGPKE